MFGETVGSSQDVLFPSYNLQSPDLAGICGYPQAVVGPIPGAAVQSPNTHKISIPDPNTRVSTFFHNSHEKLTKPV